MKPPILLLAVFLLATCPAPQAADKASSPAGNPAMPNETVSIPQMRANAENGDHRAAERLYWFYLFVGPEPGKTDPQAAEYWRKKARIEE